VRLELALQLHVEVRVQIDGEAGLNYLCAGYKSFFRHIDRPMKVMAELLRQGKEAADVMPCGVR
jgi:sulfatase maturation enzyme AslB (radical SAM superfamily)